MLRSRRGTLPAAFVVTRTVGPRYAFDSLALIVVVLSGAMLSPASAIAQQNCGAPAAVSSPAPEWPAPLDRVIAIRVRNVSLRDGLDRVAVASRVRVSYSAELLPLDRLVCLSADSIAVGDALAALLSGTGVAPVTTGSDQVVLALVRPSANPTQAMAGSVQTLERVVVTGSATGDAQRPLTVALDVLDGKKLAEQSSSTFASSFDGSVPGLWVWEQSPSSLLARYGSIRGASSFGVSYPKVYIDGIEVANPLLVTDINPAVLDHVEVIRGPQGAALYGADAISGVVNIVTRHEGTQAGADRTEASSGAGFTQTDYAARSVLAQNHALTWRGGSSMRSGSLALSISTLGGYVPEAYSRDVKLNGALRAVTSRASFTGTARYYGKQAAVGENPLLRGFTQSAASRISMRTHGRASTSATPDSTGAEPIVQDTLPESVQEYTVGGTATVFTAGHWTPSFVAGVDGYRLANVPDDLAPLSSATDTALHAARGGADRGTLRASLVGQFGLARSESLTLTLAAEHSTLRETDAGGPIVDAGGNPVASGRIAPDVIAWRRNSGLIAQGNLGIHDALYITGGLRLERNDGFTLRSQTALLPMVGMATVRDIGATTLKLRGAYGRGIRPVQTSSRSMAMHDIRWRSGSPTLDPEEQSGTELGADLMFGRQIGLHVTRFDQRAFGLIQPVGIPRDSQPSGSGTSGSGRPRVWYVLQNVGEIANRGWEMESSVHFGALGLGGALSLVDSRVQRIARGYTGDLRTGDRMLGVPARTASLSASWNQPHWYATITTSRASDWINYDRLLLAKHFADSTVTAQDVTGSKLRLAWLKYDGVTRIRATLSRDLISNFSLKITGDNLTNVQRGEPDNITVLPGRTLLLALSAKIR
jgi:iron complex outermembrane receptor protein